MLSRSTAGCYTCKRRKKKCDETQPHCLRCIRSGKECEGYAPLESPDSRGIMRRAKAGPVRGSASRPQSNVSKSRGQQPSSSSPATTGTLDQRNNSDALVPTPCPGSSLSPRVDTIGPISSVQELSPGSPIPLFVPLDSDVSSGTILSWHPNFGDHSTNQHLQNIIPSQTHKWPGTIGDGQSIAADLPSGWILEANEVDDIEDDPEGTKQESCIVPALDPNTIDNTLPFILQCYDRWMNLVVFEPDKAASPLKASLENKFKRSPEERPRMILLANVAGSLGKSIQPSPKARVLIAYLGDEVYQNIHKFLSNKPASDREVDRQNALDVLDLTMEVILIQRYSRTMAHIVKLMEAIAPVFRRACPEPMDEYVNLPRAIMSPKINIRYFATTDVIVCATTGRPMLFRYDMTCPADVFELLNDGRYGMRWLHGVPDEYIIILARINVLSEELGPEDTVSPDCVAEIEDQIQGVDLWSEDSVDPVSTIRKFMVRECWRMTAYVYLYMVLCRTYADDPRVLQSVNSYVQLVNAVKSGRNPDAFLYTPMIVVGAAAYRSQDREVIRIRMSGLQECANPGSCGYDALHILLDLWSRTDAENRAATWYDFRASALRIMGV